MGEVIADARSEKNLEQIDCFLHDQRFDIDKLRYERAAGMVALPFEKEDRRGLSGRWYSLLFHKWTVPIHEHVLELQNVKSYTLEDRAQVGRYTFTSLEYDPVHGNIRIVGSPDLQIVVEVSELALAVVSTGKSLGVRSFLTILGCEIS